MNHTKKGKMGLCRRLMRTGRPIRGCPHVRCGELNDVLNISVALLRVKAF